MKLSTRGLDLIKSFEGLRLSAYLDTGGVWTIGYGTIKYPDGTAVKEGDTCTTQQAEQWLQFEVDQKTACLNTLLSQVVTQNQFDALCSFVYNVGVGGFKGSTLRKKVNANPEDLSIRNEFMRWVNDNGKLIKGLVNRRTKEANLYFSKI